MRAGNPDNPTTLLAPGLRGDGIVLAKAKGRPPAARAEAPARGRGLAIKAIEACATLLDSYHLPDEAERLILSVLGKHIGYWGWDIRGGFLTYSPHIRDLIGLRETDVRLADYMAKIHPGDVDRVLAAMETHMTCDQLFDMEYRLSRGDAFIWVRVKAQSVRDESGVAVFMAGTLEDVTDSRNLDEGLDRYRQILEARVRDRTAELAQANARLQAEIAERHEAEGALEISRTLYHSLVENIPYAIFRKDRDGRYTFGNRLYCEMLGLELDELLGKDDFGLYPDELARKYREDDHKTIEGGEVLDTEEEHEIPGDPPRMQTVHTIKCPIRDAEGRVVGVQGMFADVTDRRKTAHLLAYQATHDGLTGLPNRNLFQDRLEEALRAASDPFAVLLIDLDRFKEINDTLGHHYGDLVLRELSPRLRAAVRPADTVARLGGDEFGIVLRDTDAEAARRVARRILDELSRPLRVDGHSLDVGASIGIAMHPDHGRDQNTLVRRADIAMYAAKKAHSGFTISSDGPSDYTPRRLALIAELRQAIGDDQFRLRYQPKVDLRTGKTLGAEALIRWQHPAEGTLAPGEFVPLAEQVGLIGAVDRWAIAASLQQCREWRARGKSLTMAVNLSASNLRDPLIAGEIVQMLRRADVPPWALIVEVTECAIMTEPKVAREILLRLREEGIAIAIDDFGIGHSSLAYLKELPVDHLKIDQSFIRGIESCGKNLSIVRSVIELGHNLGLSVTAEGVETRASMDLLARLGCDQAQGLFLGGPVPAEDFDRRLADWRPAPNSPHLPLLPRRPGDEARPA